MIEVYSRNKNGKLRVVASYADFDNFFYYIIESDLKTAFSNNDTDHYTGRLLFSDRGDTSIWNNWDGSYYCYVVYDNDKFVTVDRLVGLYRAYLRNRRSYWRIRRTCHYRQGRKKSTWGCNRHMHTTQEKTWNDAWKDEDYSIKGRAKRNKHNLPELWDDWERHTEKSWKFQTKVRKQWAKHLK